MTGFLRRRLARAAGILLITLLLCELALRPQVADLSTFQSVFTHDLRDGRCLGLVPGAEGTYEGWLQRVRTSTIRINSKGYRDRERTPKAADGVYRIVWIGDSHIFGLGTDFEQGLPHLVERGLNERFGGRIEVINAGVPGYDLVQMATWVPHVLRDWSPDAVVVSIESNDLVKVDCWRWNVQFKGALQHSVVFRVLLASVRKWMLHPQVDRASQVQLFAEQTKRIDQTLKSHGKSVNWAYLQLNNIGLDRETDAVKVLKTAGVEVLNLAPAMDHIHADPNRYVLIGEGHANATGNRLLATAATQALAGWNVVAQGASVPTEPGKCIVK